MRYDKRNRATLAELAPNTKKAALKFYEYCVEHKVEILVTDAKRTLAEQTALVKRGASKTLKSYHIVGQAFDFVPTDAKGNPIWSASAYNKDPYKGAITYAKKLGFEWGGDWKGFVDCPHLQFNYKGYGTDKAVAVVKPKPTVKPKPEPETVKYPGNPIDINGKNDKADDVKRIQRAVGVFPDGKFGTRTENAVKQYQKRHNLKADGIVGPSTWYMLF